MSKLAEGPSLGCRKAYKGEGLKAGRGNMWASKLLVDCDGYMGVHYSLNYFV